MYTHALGMCPQVLCVHITVSLMRSYSAPNDTGGCYLVQYCDKAWVTLAHHCTVKQHWPILFMQNWMLALEIQ